MKDCVIFQRNKMASETLRQDMTNISRSPFTDEIEQTEPPRKFSMSYFTSFKGDGDPERHLKHYRSTMIIYRNNDALMCKIFDTTLQGDVQDWFHTLPPQSIQNFDDLSLVFTKKYSSYRSIKKKSDHLFNVKKNPKESLRDYIKKFKAEKAKIVGCDDSIASAAFQKRPPSGPSSIRRDDHERIPDSSRFLRPSKEACTLGRGLDGQKRPPSSLKKN